MSIDYIPGNELPLMIEELGGAAAQGAPKLRFLGVLCRGLEPWGYGGSVVMGCGRGRQLSLDSEET